MWSVASVCPKSKHLCRTINYKARCYLAIGVNSVGYTNYYDRLFQKLHIGKCNVVRTSLLRRDKKVSNKRVYRERPEIKRRMAEKRIAKIKKARAEVVKSKKKGHTYESNMAVPEASVASTPTTRVRPVCPHCSLVGHKTKRSKSCKHYSGKKPLQDTTASIIQKDTK